MIQDAGGMMAYTVKALDAGSWPDFATLAEAHNGVWGGCWCQFGRHVELPWVKNHVAYRADGEPPADWQIARSFPRSFSADRLPCLKRKASRADGKSGNSNGSSCATS
jgi:hypothetical protein